MEKGKYITGYWNHIFPGEKSDRMTMVLIDAESEKVIGAMVQRNRSMEDSFSKATSDEINDLHDSITNANPEVFEDPSDFDLKYTDEFPDWFKKQ